MTSTNHKELVDWATAQDPRLAWVLTEYKKPHQTGWQNNPIKRDELADQLDGLDHVNALGVSLGHSNLMGLDFDADDWPQVR